jgi:hypothetical protein
MGDWDAQEERDLSITLRVGSPGTHELLDREIPTISEILEKTCYVV